MKLTIPTFDIAYLDKNNTFNSEKNDFFLTEITAEDVSKFPFRLNCYQIVLCISGSIEVRVQGDEYIYKKNSFAAFSPVDVIEILEVADDYKAVLLAFTNSYIVETLNNAYFLGRFSIFGNPRVAHFEVKDEDSKYILKHLEKIKRTINDRSRSYRRGVIRSLIIILLYELEHLADSRYVNPEEGVFGSDKILSDFQELLHIHFREEKMVHFYVNKLNISTAKLNKVLSILIGKTAKTIIDERRLTEAKILLKSGRYNVSEVSSILSYFNTEEFSRFFKKKTGITPLAFAHQKNF